MAKWLTRAILWAEDNCIQMNGSANFIEVKTMAVRMYQEAYNTRDSLRTQTLLKTRNTIIFIIEIRARNEKN